VRAMTARRGLIRAAGVIVSGLLAVTALSAGGTAAVADTAREDAAKAPGGKWELVPIPSMSGQADLTAVTAFSPSDAWAVGYERVPEGVRTLALHWDGKRWERVPTPNRSDDQNWLLDVAGSSPSDVWAVGYDLDADRMHRTLVMHWNGEQWRIVPSPAPESLESLLSGVVALSPTNAWAVGTAVAWPLTGQTLVLHWDGQRWSRVESPNPGVDGLGSNLLDVAAASKNDLWAVGDYSHDDMVMRTLTEHWNGKSWVAVASPTAPNGAILDGVAARSRKDAWAVGYEYGETHQQPLALRWDGTSWRKSAVPRFDGVDASFTDVAVRSRNDVWAVGSQGSETLIARWNGKSWTVVPGVDPGELVNSLTAVTAVPRSRCLWAVGQFTDGERAEPFIERYCGR